MRPCHLFLRREGVLVKIRSLNRSEPMSNVINVIVNSLPQKSNFSKRAHKRFGQGSLVSTLHELPYTKISPGEKLKT